MASGGGFNFQNQQQQPGFHPYPGQGGDAPYPPGGGGAFAGAPQAGGAPYPPQATDGPYPPPGGQGAYPNPGGFTSGPPPAQGGNMYPPMGGGAAPYPSGGSAGYPPAPMGGPGYPPAPGGDASYPPPQGGSGGYPPAMGGNSGYPPAPGGAPGYPPTSGGSAGYPAPPVGGNPYPPATGNNAFANPSGSNYPQTAGSGGPYPLPGMTQSPYGVGGVPTGGVQPTKQMVKLRIQASGLPKMDLFSKSDPMCVLFQRVGGGQWTEIGRTETLSNTHNPSWNTTFTVANERQQVKFEIYDSDGNSKNLNKKDYMGKKEVNLDTIVQQKRFNGKLEGANSTAAITVSAELMKTVHMQISASGLKDMDAYSKSDPFFSIKCRDPYGYYKAVYTSETIKDDLNPRWKPFSVVDSELCSRGDYNSPLKIMVFDWDKMGSHDLIGQCEVTLGSLQSANSRGAPLELVNPKKRKGRTGLMSVDSIRVV